MTQLRDKTAIVGIGETEYSKNSGMSGLALLLQASIRAIVDAGLSPKDIDGVLPPMYQVVEDFVVNLGIESLNYAATIRMGGASAVANLQSAAMAVASGICNNVLCVTGRNGYSESRLGAIVAEHSMTQARSGRPFEANLMDFWRPYGMSVAAQWYALQCARHMHEYGITSRQLGAVAVAMRKHALLNEKAMMKTPITIDDHQNSKIICEPLHLLDCCLESDGAAAFVVSSAKRAKNMRHCPVYIMGVAEGHPDMPNEISNRPDMTEFGVKKAAPRAFAMAGVTHKDIDVAEIYDCFTWVVIRQLENIGFCKNGEGGSFVEGGRIELGGELPVNTHGGLLSQAHILGMNHIVEAVKQLRGEAGKAQVKDAEIALVSGYGDLSDGSIAILRR